MDSNKLAQKIPIFGSTSTTIGISGTLESTPIDISKLSGDCTLQLIYTGTGTLTATYKLGIDGTPGEPNSSTMTAPTGASAILTAAASGTRVGTFTPGAALEMSILLTEAGGAANVSLTSAYLCIK